MIGRTISHYKILSLLGEGGMGVVYQAEDTKLERSVALKFLAPHLVQDPEVRKRFEREAKAAASLDHANVCTVYEIDEAEEKTFIAMACVEGESLDRKIARGPLKLEEALDIAQQIATGLEAAHEKGIFHRDIKPENVIVDSKGHVTIMDFGLAQLTEASRLTKTDQTVGTTAYMSPEQTEGSGTDQRTDIWALGVVLYEMATGQQPFKGDYDQAVMYSILNEEPKSITGLRTGVPMELEVFVNKCLAKRPDDRYSSAREFGTDLRACADHLKSGTTATSQSNALSTPVLERGHKGVESAPSRRLERFAWSAALAAAAVVIALLWRHSPTQTTDRSPARFSFAFDEIVTEPVISPDGKHIAYVRESGAARSIWVQDLDQDEPRKILEDSTRFTTGLAWSPDGKFIAHKTREGLSRVPQAGGPSQRVVSTPLRLLRGFDWSPDGQSIVFSAVEGEFRRLYVVPAQGGSPEVLFEPDPKHRNRRYPFLHFLPGRAGRALLCSIREAAAEPYQIVVKDLETGREEKLADGLRPFYSPSGHVVYESESGGLWALPFSIQTLTATGDPFPIRENASRPSVAHDGSLVYLSGQSFGGVQLIWVDAGGRELASIGQPQRFLQFPALSPQETQVAVAGVEDDEEEVWIHDVERPVKTRITFSPSFDRRPLWSATGTEILFSSYRGTGRLHGIYRKPADGTGEAQLVHSTEQMNSFASDWSADGRYIVYDVHSQGGTTDIWYLKSQDEGTFTAHPYLARTFTEKAARISPDGRWLAYVSDESGEFQVYVQRFPEGGDKIRVSYDGGMQPIWGNKGDRLYFVADETLFRAKVEWGESLAVSDPTPLIQSVGLRGQQLSVHPQYDVSADGERFVFRKPVGFANPVIRITQNWYEEFRDREQPVIR